MTAMLNFASLQQGLPSPGDVALSKRPRPVQRRVSSGGGNEPPRAYQASILCTCSLGLVLQQRRRRSSAPSVRLAIQNADTATTDAKSKPVNRRYRPAPAAASWRENPEELEDDELREEELLAAEEAPARSSQRKLVAEVEILHLDDHPEQPFELSIAEVEDPEFPGARLRLVVEQGRWTVGARGLLLQVGCKVPRKIGEFQGLFRQLAGKALMESQGDMEGPLKIGRKAEGIHSQGFLLPLTSDKYDGLESLSAQVEMTKEFHTSALIELSFCGHDRKTSDRVETKLRKALMQLGCLPPWSNLTWDRLSRTEKGVHARSYRVGVPQIRVQAADLQEDGTFPELTKALNRRLEKWETLQLHQVRRMPFSAKMSQACSAREYRYYLHRSFSNFGGSPDKAVEQRLAETLKLCEGSHSFFNFCDPEETPPLVDKLERSEEGQRWFESMQRHRIVREKQGFPEDTRFGKSEWSSIPEVARRMCTSSISLCDVETCDFDDQLLCVRIVSTGFLHSQVRLVVGSCCAVSLGILSLDTFQKALEAENFVDLMDFLAPSKGLVLHSQTLEAEQVPWLTPDSASGELADSFFDTDLVPHIQRAWLRDRSLGLWHRKPSHSVMTTGLNDEVDFD